MPAPLFCLRPLDVDLIQIGDFGFYRCRGSNECFLLLVGQGFLDYLPDQFSPGPEDEAYEHALKDTIEEALGTLKEREAKILRLYFGLDDQEPMTLEEIGSILGITRERVRQIKEKALVRLRHASRARVLETFM